MHSHRECPVVHGGQVILEDNPDSQPLDVPSLWTLWFRRNTRLIETLHSSEDLLQSPPIMPVVWLSRPLRPC